MYELNDADWQVVDRLAKDLANLDLNVAMQASTYLGQVRSVNKLLTWLSEIKAQPEIVRRSGQTPRYYADLYRLCQNYFQNEANYERAHMILGWGVRVARYYKKTNAGTSTPGANQPPGQRPFPNRGGRRY